MGDEIVAISREKLNVEAYDRCLAQDNNSKIYAKSWYLDSMADSWYALVKGDYKQVMPLPTRRKWGISYIYQPFMVQQLGVFPSDKTDLTFFNEAISRHFHLDYTFHNHVHQLSPESRINLVLDIHPTMVSLEKRLSTNRRRDLKRAENAKLTITYHDTWESIKPIVSGQLKPPYQNAEAAVQRLIKNGAPKGGIRVAAVHHQGACVYFVLFGKSGQRVYYLLPVMRADKAKTFGVATWTIIQLIKKYKHAYSTFDFEGSEIPGVRKFYESFGAEVEEYYHTTRSFFQFMKHAR